LRQFVDDAVDVDIVLLKGVEDFEYHAAATAAG